MTHVGYAALLLALAATAYSTLSSALGARTHQPRRIKRAEMALFLAALCAVLATAILLYLLLSRNFQVRYVYAHTNSYQPTLYVISALWAGQEGSLLLWSLLLSVVSVAVLLQKRSWPADLWPYMLAALAIVQSFFALLLVAVQNPFATYATRPLEGAGILPVLENPGMVIHPPILFLGYAIYSVPFAFGIARLIAGHTRDRSSSAPRPMALRLIREWSVLAWLFLGAGILVGAWWAYVELGWGGYWSWDAVENASLLPWLIGTAYIHSLMAQERRGIFKRWSIVLAISAFSLCIFSTLVTRGGIIVSDLHGFSQSTQPIAYYLLGFIAAIMAASAILFYRQRDKSENEPHTSGEQTEHLLSRESSLLLSNLIFVGLAMAILVGIVFPNLAQGLWGRQVYLGSTFYNRVFTPLALAIVLLIGICSLLGWKKSSGQKLLQITRYPVIGAVAAGVMLFVLGIRQPLALLAFGLIALAAASIVSQFIRYTIKRSRLRNESTWRAVAGLFRSGRRRYGGQLVHLSILMIAVGITGSSLYKTEYLVTLARGDVVAVQGYTLRYENLALWNEVGKQRYAASLGVYRGQSRIGTLKPEKIFHVSVQEYTTEVSIRTTGLEDLYVALDWLEENGSASFRIYVYPLVVWLWIGGGLLLFGTLVAIWPDPTQPGGARSPCAVRWRASPRAGEEP